MVQKHKMHLDKVITMVVKLHNGRTKNHSYYMSFTKYLLCYYTINCKLLTWMLM